MWAACTLYSGEEITKSSLDAMQYGFDFSEQLHFQFEMTYFG